MNMSPCLESVTSPVARIDHVVSFTRPSAFLASFPGLQSPNAVEGLVKLLRRMTSNVYPTSTRDYRKNDVSEITANLLSEVCNDVRVEPDLQELTTEELSGRTANTTDGARLDIAVNGFWGGRFERSFLDVRVFNPYAPSTGIPPLRNASEGTSWRKRGPILNA